MTEQLLRLYEVGEDEYDPQDVLAGNIEVEVLEVAGIGRVAFVHGVNFYPEVDMDDFGNGYTLPVGETAILLPNLDSAYIGSLGKQIAFLNEECERRHFLYTCRQWEKSERFFFSSMRSSMLENYLVRFAKFQFLSREASEFYYALGDALCHAKWNEAEQEKAIQQAERKALHVSQVRSEMASHYEKAFIAIGRRDGFQCAYCGQPSADLQIDHVTPVSKGGGNDLSNLRLACKPCNLSKGAREVAQ